MQDLSTSAALNHAVGALLQTAVRGGVLVWGAFVGRALLLISTGVFRREIAFPVTFLAGIVLATLPAAYGFYLMVDPDQSKREAFYDAQVTFFCVLFTLWAGAGWGIYTLLDLEQKKPAAPGGSLNS